MWKIFLQTNIHISFFYCYNRPPVERQKLVATVDSSHALVVCSDEVRDVDLHVDLLALVPAAHLRERLHGVVVGPHDDLLVVEPLDKEDSILRHIGIHGAPPFFPQVLLQLEGAPLHPVAAKGAHSRQLKLSEKKLIFEGAETFLTTKIALCVPKP